MLPVLHRHADGTEKELTSLHNPVLVPSPAVDKGVKWKDWPACRQPQHQHRFAQIRGSSVRHCVRGPARIHEGPSGNRLRVARRRAVRVCLYSDAARGRPQSRHATIRRCLTEDRSPNRRRSRLHWQPPVRIIDRQRVGRQAIRATCNRMEHVRRRAGRRSAPARQASVSRRHPR